MFSQAMVIALSILWLLICLRFYTLIARKNILQRRLLAIGAGLGAGLLYILGNLLLNLIQVPPPTVEPHESRDIRIQSKPLQEALPR